MILLIDDAIERKLYSELSLIKQKYKILLKTYRHEEAKILSEKVPGDHTSELEKMIKTSEELEATLKPKTEKLIQLFQNQEFMNDIEADTTKDKKSTFEKYLVTDDDKNAVFDYSKLLYEKGKYEDSAKILSSFKHLVKSHHLITILWGLVN